MLIGKKCTLFIRAIFLHLPLTWAGWTTNFAKASNNHILRGVYVSDWSTGSVLISKEIFGNMAFMQFTDTCIVLVNGGFPKLKESYPGEEPSPFKAFEYTGLSMSIVNRQS